MAPAHQPWNHCVDERIRIIADGLGKHDSLQDKLPGLKSLLDDYLDPSSNVGTDADREGFHRRLLQVFRDSRADFAYETCLKKFRPDEQKRVADFVDGRSVSDAGKNFTFGPSLGVREHLKLMHHAEGGPVIVDGLSTVEDVERDTVFQRLLHGLLAPCDQRRGDSIIVSTLWFPPPPSPTYTHKIGCQRAKMSSKKKKKKVYKNAPFQNWGRVVDYVPTFTCIPSTVAGVQRIVQYAKSQDMGVRCAGFRRFLKIPACLPPSP